MGASPSRCNRCGTEISGNGPKYCASCLEQVSPTCSYCGRPLLPYQHLNGSYHEFPCYSNATQRCMKCNSNAVDPQLDRSYCRTCYDSTFPPPRVVELRKGDFEAVIYGRGDEPLLKSLSLALEGGGLRYLTDH